MNKLVSEISEAAIIDHDLLQKTGTLDLMHLSLKFCPTTKKPVNIQSWRSLIPGLISYMNGLPDRIGQVIVNLVENAISFTRPVGIINVVYPKMAQIITIVEDNGPGVRDELKK